MAGIGRGLTTALLTGAVLLTGSQTITGSKTFSGFTTFSRTAQTGTAEQHLRFTVSDDAVGSGSIGNYTATNGTMVMSERGITNSATDFAHAWVAQANADSGTLPAGIFQSVNSSIAALTTRPMFGWYNGSNLRMQMAANGAITSTVGSAASTSEEQSRWTVSDNTGSFARIMNGVGVDGLYFPEIGGYLTSTSISALTRFSSELAADAVSATSAMVFQVRTGPASAPVALANRIPMSFLNGPNVMALFTAGGSFSLRQAGQGLQVQEGANCKQGTATLSAGTVTVVNTSVTANSRIFLTAQDNSSVGVLRVSARVAGTSFTITSSNAGDSGVVAYEIFEPS